MAEAKTYLDVNSLCKNIGDLTIVDNASFSVLERQKVGLVGRNGTGKSTLLNIIGGIDSADSGYISINGDKLEDMDEKRLTQYRRRHLHHPADFHYTLQT